MLLSPDQLRLPFHGLLEVAAQRCGDKPALLHGDERYSFRELDARSNAFAHALRDRGIGAGERVALYAFTRPEWIIALFAVLKTIGQDSQGECLHLQDSLHRVNTRWAEVRVISPSTVTRYRDEQYQSRASQ